MPLLHIHIAEGKPPEKKKALLDAVAEAVRTSLDADVKSIRIFLHEFPRDHYRGVDM